MSIWPEAKSSTPPLFGIEGELVLLRLTVEPRLLEDLLDTLARLDFPVNPELCHRANQVLVDFPAYEGKIDEVRRILKAYRFDSVALEKTRILALAAQA